MPVAHAVDVVELVVDLLERDRGADRHVDRVLLADVAHVGRAGDVAVGGTDPLRLEQRGALCLERSEGAGNVVGLQLGERPVEARTTSWRMSVCSMPQAEKVPGLQGTITSPISSSSASQTACIGPAPPNATSEYSRGSIPCLTVIVRIASAIFALTIASIPSASAVVRARPAPTTEASAPLCRALVERHPAAEEVPRVEPAEEEVGVRDRRLRPAAAVAGRARIRSGALRPDAQATRLEPRERAAPRADRVDVDERHQHRQALELGLGRDGRLAVDDQAEIERRPAHVDAEQVAPSGRPGERRTADRPADRPGEQRLNRLLRALRALVMPPFDCIT